MNATRLALSALSVLCAVGGVSCRKQAQTQAQPVASRSASAVVPPPTDPDLAAAERTAFQTLPKFVAALKQGGQTTGHFELEAFVEDGGMGERLWLNDVRPGGDGFDGAIDTLPTLLKLERGRALHVASARVVDWSYEERGKVVGGETRLIVARRKRELELADALPKCTDARFADGCAALAQGYATGAVGELRQDVAYELDSKACSGGSAYGCNAAGWASVYGRGTVQNWPAAVLFFARACTTGDEHPFACDSRGFALLSGLAGTSRDIALGARLLKKPCERGVAQSCLLLELLRAKHLAHGAELPLACEVNIAEQVSRCTGDKDPEACFLAGSAFATGVCGAPRSQARSAQYLAGAAAFGATWSDWKADHGVVGL